MKKFIKNSIFTFLFAVAFIFCGAVSVNAVEPALNNATIHTGENDIDVTLLNNKYYVLVGNDTVVLDVPLSKSYRDTWLGAANYRASVHVFKLDATGKSWSEYTYSGDAMTMLKSSGLSLNFSEMTFKSTSAPNNNGEINVSDNVFGKNTYFVTVSYTSQALGLFNIVPEKQYAADVYRVVLAQDVSEIAFNVSNNGTTANVGINSGLPIASIRYFSASSETTISAANFDSLYKSATTKNTVNVGTGTMSKTVSLSEATSQYYYVEVTDIAGGKSVLDVRKNVAVDQEPAQQAKPEITTDTKIGEIILIALIAVFVLAIVLVIVQRIIDYKKKLY